MAIKIANVDVKMSAIIAWMNKHPGIYTLFCCQGDFIQDKPVRPGDCYIMWIYHGKANCRYGEYPKLREIRKALDNLGATTRQEVYCGTRRFMTTWASKAEFERARKWALEDLKRIQEGQKTQSLPPKKEKK